MSQGYSGLPAYYAESSDPITPNIGFSLKGMDPIVAYNFVLADTAIGGGGTSVKVNGATIANPNFNNTTPAAPANNVNVIWQVDGTGHVSAYVPVSGTGTVTSVALTAPAEFSVGGSPITTSGTLAITKATQTANTVWAGPTSGIAAQPAFRALVAADLPAGTGTVTSVAMTGDGVVFNATVTGSPITTSGTLAPALLTQTANTFFAGPTSGGAATPTFRAIGAGDIPSGTVLWNQIGNAAGALSLSNGTNATTFNQTAATLWTWANTTAATAGSDTNISPKIILSSFGFGSGASVADTVTLEVAHGLSVTHEMSFAIVGSNNTGQNAWVDIRGLTGLRMFGSSSGLVTLAPASASATLDVSVPVNATTGFRIGNAATTAHYLRGNGTNYVDSAIQIGDLPTITAAKGGTGIDSSASTGVAQVAAGTWSISTALASGTTATTQAQQDNSTKVATTAYVDAYEISAAAGFSYFFGAFGPFFSWAAGANAARTANQSDYMMFYVPFATTITKVTIFVNAVSASASQFASAGLYNTAGNKVVDSGTFNVSSGQATGYKTNTIAGVALNPGFYYFAFTTNSTDATFAVTVAANGSDGALNNNGNRCGKGAASTNGALNGTVGSFTKQNTTPPLVLFEP